MAEESEFELPVPVSKLSYDSIMLGFAIETGLRSVVAPHSVSGAL